MSAAFPLDLCGLSHVGRVRDLNEDRWFADAEAGVFVVADGMGGHEGGERASAAIVAELASLGLAVSAPDLKARVEDRMQRAHRWVQRLGEAAGGTIGSTVAALLLFDRQFGCLWAGDSRLYLLREGRLNRVSRDHSEVQDLLDRGAISPQEARTWPRRNVITRALGAGGPLDLDFAGGALCEGDVFLVCSDGLTAHLEDDEIAGMLASTGPASVRCERLLGEALARGGQDNVTVLVVRCLEARPGAAVGFGRG